MNSQTPAALTLGPGGNGTFYAEKHPKSDAVAVAAHILHQVPGRARRYEKRARTRPGSAGGTRQSPKSSRA